MLLGTPDYLAPEQARNARAVDIRADIYSAGCVLYHCLAGHPPFPDTNIINQMIRHAQEAPKPLKELNPEVSDGLQMVINYMMAKDPNQRYPTPGQAAQALKPFLAAGSDMPHAAEPDASMTQYLNWLETNADIQRSGPVPVAAPVAQAVPSGKKKRKGSRTARYKLLSRLKKKRKDRKAAGDKPPRTDKVKKGVLQRSIDVELVPVGGVSPANAAVPPARGFSRRDVLLLAAGAGSVAVVAAVGGLMASGGIGSFLHKLGLGHGDSETRKK